MKLNKVHRGRESVSKGASILAGPTQPELKHTAHPRFSSPRTGLR